jgi:hypothetical protein
MAKLNIKLIKDKAIYIFKNLPAIFARHYIALFLAGALLTLTLAIYIFYKEAYLVVRSKYDAPTAESSINKELFEAAINHITEQSRDRGPFPADNPFVK